ncbi:hypothetical protein ID866_5231 [Astraeus odoratus]|nr:hypothetical protein ID866_5231 [Astraeus odoratus]
MATILGVSPSSITGQIGFTCSPVTVGGVGTGGNCVTQAVCCDDVYFNGAVNVGCSPTTIIS